MLKALIETMRPHQWVKNLLVLTPLLFAHQRVDMALVIWPALLACGVFCVLSSSIYLLNDVIDRHADAAHPTKQRRPLPSGRLSVAAAIVMFLVLALTAAVGAVLLDGWRGRGLGELLTQPGAMFLTWPLAYFLLNLLYTSWLKHQVIVDCVCIALGFQIRVHAGAMAIGVSTSPWILLCTFFFALFLAFCKRREEVRRMGGEAATRKTLREYDLPFLDQLIAPLAALSILSYALYTVAPDTIDKHGPNLQFTVPFVVFGVFRYLFLVHRRGAGADPSKLLFRDPQLLLSGALWAVAALLAMRAGA